MTHEKLRKEVIVSFFLLLKIVFIFPLKCNKKKFKRLTFSELSEICRVRSFFRLPRRHSFLHMYVLQDCVPFGAIAQKVIQVVHIVGKLSAVPDALFGVIKFSSGVRAGHRGNWRL